MTQIAPDWTAIEETIRCPLCTYDLRGLGKPRCPECGYRFEWDELLDPLKRLHPFLFEHHPKRNVETYFKTLLNGLRPRAFWKSVHPVQPSVPRRIVLYWFISAALLVAAGLTCFLMFAHVIATQNALIRPAWEANPRGFLSESLIETAIAEHGSMQRYFDIEMPTHVFGVVRNILATEPTIVLVAALPYAVPLACPWATFACLLVFAQSMRRARVGRVHVLRCVFYSFDVVFWIGLAYFAVLGLYLLLNGSARLVSILGVGAVFRAHCWTVVPFLIFAWLRLWIAYRVYLRFPHAAAVIGASALVVVLATAAFFGFFLFRW